MSKITKLAHTSENFSVEVEGKTNAAILEEIKDAGHKLGKESLKALLDGSKAKAGDFEAVVEAEAPAPAPTETKKPNKKAAAADAAKAAAADDKKPEEEKKPEPEITEDKSGPKVLTPEQAKLAAEVEKEIPTREPAKNVEKAPRVLKDFSHLLPKPGEYGELLRGTTMSKLFEGLCRDEGMTKAEMMTEFGWSAGGLAGIIHWEPKKKGYTLGSVKKEGVIHYHLMWHAADPARPNGHLQKVKLDELKYREKKVAPPPKTQEEKDKEKAAKQAQKDAEKAAKAADKAAGAPAPAPKAPDAPAAGGGNVTKRVSAKKQAELAKKAAEAAGAAPTA